MVKFFATTMALAMGICGVASARQTRPIEYAVTKWNKFQFHTVSVDLTSDTVSPAVVHTGKLESIQSLLGEEKPAVAVTGTFFHPQSAYPVGDIVIDGQLTAQGWRGSVIGVDWFGRVSITDSPFQQPIDLSNYRFAMRGLMRLIRNGQLAIDPRGQRFTDPRLWGRASRCALGISKDRRLIIMTTRQNVSLTELGKAMQQAGAVQAVNLDGGSSTALYYEGEVKVAPARRLSNMFVVYDRSPFRLPGM